MEEKNIKRGYYFPEALLKAWEEFHWPSKTFGTSPEGAFLIWLALRDFPQIREAAGRLAHNSDINTAIEIIQKMLAKALVQVQVQGHMDDMIPDQDVFLGYLKQLKAKADQNKKAH